jgi:CheY-like chemotaxis protein
LQSAETASRSRADFLANTSHEIRTPMNSVLGMAYLALQTTSDPRQRGFLEKIQRSGAHLMRILDDILDFSKIDAGKLELETTSFDLDISLEHLLHWSEDRARDKGLQLRLECAPDVPRQLMGDPLRLKQILLNFVSNAIKFTERGSVVLRLHCLERNAQDCVIRFDVEDTGMGLTEAECARLFQSFEQADTSITRKFGGTGLGLAISRQLALLMGGDVGVSSVPGMGSTFWFCARFPLGQSVPTLAGVVSTLSQSVAALRGSAILVVDDNEFNLEVAKGLLEGLGVEVQTAADGAQAIAMLSERHFDCVMMDVQMPVMDGLEATRRIRADARIANTLVIAMTANASGADHARCLQAGMNDVIKKPVEPEKMFLTLATHLHPHRPRPEFSSSAHVTPVTDSVAAPATPKSDALAQWDRQALQTYVGKQPQRQQKLLVTFLVSAEEIVRAIPLAIRAEDWKATAALGHKLKSSSRCVGAMQLATLCESLEHAGKHGDAENCTGLAPQVQAEFAELRALMEGELSVVA